MTINQFQRPIELEGTDAQIMLIIRLILLDPGTIQTHPDMGVGLVSLYRYTVDVDLDKLRNRIQSQISRYLPMFTTVQVRVDLNVNEHTLYMYIDSDQLNALVPFDTENLTVIQGLDNIKV
jgi:hypothetical protein